MSDAFNLSDSEFDSVLTTIDADLRRESDHVPGREIRGLMAFCKRFNVSLAFHDPTAQRVFDWFSRLYGDRLKLDWNFGRTVVSIKGDLCRVHCFRFFGVMPLICSPVLMELKLRKEVRDGVVVDVHNVLMDKCIKGLTADMARRLDVRECDDILEAYSRAFLAFSKLEAALGKRRGGDDAPYISEAIHDLIGSVESLLTSPPNYGQSKWSSLQAAEKVVKSCIRQKGSIPKKSHDLTSLCATAKAVGVTPVNSAIIQKIECSADVRYDSSLVTKNGALEAHYGVLDLCTQLADTVKRTDAHSDIFSDELRTSRDFATKMMILCYAAPSIPPKKK